jgi:hypothetical protein
MMGRISGLGLAGVVLGILVLWIAWSLIGGLLSITLGQLLLWGGIFAGGIVVGRMSGEGKVTIIAPEQWKRKARR